MVKNCQFYVQRWKLCNDLKGRTMATFQLYVYLLCFRLCLTAAGCPSGLGAGQQLFTGFNLVSQATPFAKRKGLVMLSCYHRRNLM